MIHSRVQTLLLVGCLLLPVVGVAQSELRAQTADVLGIRLGMPYEEAVRIANAHLPKGRGVLGEVTYKGVPPVPIVFFYWREADLQSIQVDFAGPPAPRTVTRVMRRENYQQGQEANYQETVKALLAKYGKPSSSKGGSFRWVFDSTGNQQADTPAIEKACQAQTNSQPNVNTYTNELSLPAGPGNDQYRMSKGTCGVILQVEISQDYKNPQLALGVGATLIDHRAMSAATERTRNHVIEAGERLGRAEGEKSKANKPKF